MFIFDIYNEKIVYHIISGRLYIKIITLRISNIYKFKSLGNRVQPNNIIFFFFSNVRKFSLFYNSIIRI